MNLHVKREKNQQKYIVDTILWKERILTLKNTKTSLVRFVTKRCLFLKKKSKIWKKAQSLTFNIALKNEY